MQEELEERERLELMRSMKGSDKIDSNKSKQSKDSYNNVDTIGKQLVIRRRVIGPDGSGICQNIYLLKKWSFW